jgi:hypothetical protein
MTSKIRQIADGTIIDTLTTSVNASTNAVNVSPVPTSLNPVYGQQIATATKASPYNVINIAGRTLVNLMGRDGNCESLTPFLTGSVTLALDATNNTMGSNGVKLTLTASTGYLLERFTYLANKCYIVLADVKNGTATNMSISNNSGAASSLITDTTKFNTVWFKYTGATDFADYVVVGIGGASTQYGYVDAIRIYEVSQAEYNALGTTLTDITQIANKYLYVDDVKHVNAPYIIRYGENMLPPLSDWSDSSAGAAVGSITQVAPYTFTVNKATTANFSSMNTPKMSVVFGQPYTLTVPVSNYTLTGGAGIYIQIQTFDAVTGAQVNQNTYFTAGGNLTVQYTPASNIGAISLQIGIDIATTGTCTVSNPRLNIGAVDKGFKPRNDDYLFFPNTAIASNFDGTVFDQIFRRDGKFFRENRFARDLVLDGSLSWGGYIDFTGFKFVSAPITMPISNFGVCVKYDGKILSLNTSSVSAGDQFQVTTTPVVGISIADTDSGWGETYAPTVAEMQAYFYGWKMTVSGQQISTAYNGTGTKAWCEISIAVTSPTNTTATTTVLPTAPAPGGNLWKPYKFTYQLATPTLEEIPFEGSISTLEGSNQFEVGNGMIVRERVAQELASGNAYINGDGTSKLRNRASKFYAVYKNGKIDLGWTFISRLDFSGSYLFKPQAQWDTTATYEVTYLALDQYALTSNVQTINGEYDSNIKMVIDRLSQNQADIDTRVSTNERRLGGAQNVWGDNTRDSRSIISVVSTNPLTFAVNNTWYKIPFASKTRDNLNEYNLSLNKFTASKTGTYLILSGLGVSSMSTGLRVLISLYKNGSRLPYYIGDIQYTGTQYGTTRGALLLDLVVGDVIEYYANQTDGSGCVLDTSTLSYLQIMQIA